MRGAKKDEKRKPLLYDTMAEGERVSEKCRHHPRGKKIASTIFGTFAKKTRIKRTACEQEGGLRDCCNRGHSGGALPLLACCYHKERE